MEEDQKSSVYGGCSGGAGRRNRGLRGRVLERYPVRPLREKAGSAGKSGGISGRREYDRRFQPRDRPGEEPEENGAAAGKALLGLAVILMVFLTAGFCAAELLRGFRLWKMALVLHRADVTGRALAAEKLMFAMIRLLGVDAGLGWAADTADQELSERFEAIEPGEYRRASQLLEKAVYGEILLEPFEERTLYSFLDKLADAGRTLGPVTRLRIRYLIFGEAFHGRKGQLQDRKK